MHKLAALFLTAAASAGFAQGQPASNDQNKYQLYECENKAEVAGGRLEVRTRYVGYGRFNRQEIEWYGPIKADYGSARAEINWIFYDERELGTLNSDFISFVIRPRAKGIRYSQWRLAGREEGTGLSVDIDRNYEGNARLNYGELRRFMAGRQRNYWALRKSSNNPKKLGVLTSGNLENALFLEIERSIESVQAQLRRIQPSDIAACTPVPYETSPDAEI